ncbi:Chalcone isomerase-like protein 1 [Linum perenne]
MEEAKKEVVVVAEEEIAVEVEPNTGISFPVKLADGKQLITCHLFSGLFCDSENLKAKITKQPTKPTKEMYQAVIDDDSSMTFRLVIVFSALTMNMVKKSFHEGLGSSIKKLTGGKKNDELAYE